MDDPIHPQDPPALRVSLSLVQSYLSDLRSGRPLATVRVLERHVKVVLATPAAASRRARRDLRCLAQVCAAHRSGALSKPPKRLKPVLARLAVSVPRLLNAAPRHPSTA